MVQSAAHLLTRNTAYRADRGPAPVGFLPGLSLARGRVHELCGPTRRQLAVQVAGAMDGPVFWIAPAWQAEQLCPQGILPVLDPSRIILVRPDKAIDLLWSLEEVLRTGVVPLVVGDLPAPPGLTPVRRLQLAAESGAQQGVAPLGLLLTPDTGGAPGVESRWFQTPVAQQTAHAPDPWATPHHAPQRLTRLRDRSQPPKTWLISPTRASVHLSECPTDTHRAAPE